MDPLATVVVTTHNRPAWAQRAVRSALTQTVHDLEVVVVDDGSDPPFVADVRRRAPPRRSARTARTGVCAARNRGLDEARGTWITFLDDDDVLVPDMLRTSIDAAERSELPEPVAVDVGRHRARTRRRGERGLRPGSTSCDGARTSSSNAGAVPDVPATASSPPRRSLRSIGGFDEHLEAFQHGDLGLRLNAVASIQGFETRCTA